MRTRRSPSLPVGLGDPDIPYDRSNMSQEGISGIPSATGGLKSMKLDFADQAAQAQIPPGAGVPPSGMQGAMPPAGMQGGPDPSQMDPGMQQQSPLLAGLGAPPQQQGMDTSMFSDQDLMAMADDGSDQMGQQMFDSSMQDPQIQQQLLLAARRQMGGGGF